MHCLGIETSCDETAVAVVADGRTILSNIVASQLELHSRYGGIVPELASRRHLELFLPVLQTALDEANVTIADIDLIAVTRGPGLMGSLMVGTVAAKMLSYVHDIPLVAVHHLAGHVWANVLDVDNPPAWPAICLIVSGGHTELVYIPEGGTIRRLGGTRDDAAGEAFDKVARLLGLPYPGGPEIDRAARAGDKNAFDLPRAMLEHDSYDFSFSGLKTAVAIEVERLQKEGNGAPLPVADLAASFQQAVVDVLVAKTVRAAQDLQVNTVLLAGGVAANSALRQALVEASAEYGIAVTAPPPELCTDNGAMIAAAGTHAFRGGRVDDLLWEPAARLPLTQL